MSTQVKGEWHIHYSIIYGGREKLKSLTHSLEQGGEKHPFDTIVTKGKQLMKTHKIKLSLDGVHNVAREGHAKREREECDSGSFKR